jgi:hypothetical protein
MTHSVGERRGGFGNCTIPAQPTSQQSAVDSCNRHGVRRVNPDSFKRLSVGAPPLSANFRQFGPSVIRVDLSIDKGLDGWTIQRSDRGAQSSVTWDPPKAPLVPPRVGHDHAFSLSRFNPALSPIFLPRSDYRSNLWSYFPIKSRSTLRLKFSLYVSKKFFFANSKRFWMKMKILILHTKFVELILEKLEIQIQSVIRKPLSFLYPSNFFFSSI